jgi:PAS domain S-box-containing protein
MDTRGPEALLKAGALQSAIFNSANFSSIATDANGVIQIFNVGAERMLGYAAADVMNKITPADISDPQELIARAKTLSVELGSAIAPGFQALAFKASRGIEDIYELTYIRKDRSRFPAIVSVTALRDDQNDIIGYLLIGTDNTARKAAEEALHKAGALQRAIFDSANFSSIATDANGVIQIFNVGAERMLGYVAAEVVNKVTPAHISDSSEIIARSAALSLEFGTSIAPGFEALVFKASRGIEDIYELTYLCKDGRRLPAVVSVTALRDAQDGIIGYLLIGTDNTARKRAEEELLKAGALQSAIFNSANFSSIATDANGVIQIFNVGAERMLGYTASEVMNKITPADISDPQEVIARATALSAELGTPITPGFEALVFKASRGIEDIYELTYLRKDGRRLPAVVSVTALRDAQDAIIGYLLIGTDNTARKQVEEERAKLDQEKQRLLRELEQSAERSRLLIEGVRDYALFTMDPEGRVTSWNTGAERIKGYKEEEIVGKNYSVFYEKSDVAAGRPEQDLKRAADTDRYEEEGRRVRKDGSVFWASAIITSLRSPDGRLRGFAKVTRDITKRRQADLVLANFTARLQRSNEDLQEFAMIASHDLQEPLRKIQMFGDRLKQEFTEPLGPTGQDYINRMQNAAARGQSLIEGLLAFSRVTTKAQPPKMVELRAIATEVTADLEARIAQVGGTIEIGSLPAIEADPLQMRQLIQNLLGNALKFRRPEVPPTVRISATPIETQDARAGWQIAVADNGIGFDEKYLDRIFKLFQRLHERGTYEGAGMGLAISRKIVERHHGTITARSTPGQGTTMLVTLPSRQQEEGKNA